MIKLIKENKKFFLVSYFFSLLFYMFFIVNQLTNAHDGLWHGVQYSNFNNGSTGRMLLYWLDQLHLGIHAEPITTFIALLFFSLASLIIVNIFNAKGIFAYIISFYLISSSVTLCTLSYRYTSISYALGFFLSLFSVWLLKADLDAQWRFFGSSICLILSMAIYQANISCFSVAFVFMILYFLRSGSKLSDVMDYVIAGTIVFIISCILYKVIWNIYLKVFDLEVISYRGADNVSVVSIFSSLPQRIFDAYKYFFRFFLVEWWVKHNIFQRFIVFRYLYLIVIICMLVSTIKTMISRRTGDGCIGIALLLIFVLPIASNMVMLIATETNPTILMTFALVLVFPCTVGLISDDISMTQEIHTGASAVGKAFSRFSLLFSVIVLLGSLFQTSVDTNVMYETKIITENLMDRVVDDLNDRGLLSEKKKYVFIGYPKDNKLLFARPQLFDYSNEYLQIGGGWWGQGQWLEISYQSVLRNIGINIPVIDDYEMLDEIANSSFVDSMPQFPDEGSVLETNDIVIVKIGE